jgi:hypothetical protein
MLYEAHQDGFSNHTIRIRPGAFDDLAPQRGEGYCKNLACSNGYIEIIFYDKLLKDAASRNRVLFERLGLHKN